MSQPMHLQELFLKKNKTWSHVLLPAPDLDDLRRDS